MLVVLVLLLQVVDMVVVQVHPDKDLPEVLVGTLPAPKWMVVEVEALVLLVFLLIIILGLIAQEQMGV